MQMLGWLVRNFLVCEKTLRKNFSHKNLLPRQQILCCFVHCKFRCFFYDIINFYLYIQLQKNIISLLLLKTSKLLFPNVLRFCHNFRQIRTFGPALATLLLYRSFCFTHIFEEEQWLFRPNAIVVPVWHKTTLA